MYMNGLMLIHIEEKTYSKNYKQRGYLFCRKDRYYIYTCKQLAAFLLSHSSQILAFRPDT